jgi:hypothetical protein
MNLPHGGQRHAVCPEPAEQFAIWLEAREISGLPGGESVQQPG